MSGPEEIPEDKIESWPCDYCNGNITKVGKGHFQCDSCDWEHQDVIGEG
jgi:tRNA(Ile2) C34 agmatinyltransferase TiaS